eukprot:TRINITY_DN8606_c0_g1_i10.p1 TRINITY_DN8606_c0_g1~~TRINITY_DN8606_c0_g1_i10.p1  ORF type:complete len:420 (-),score=84.85 TRINITY_DN8606_c0_g1_i10:34-1224(-)
MCIRDRYRGYLLRLHEEKQIFTPFFCMLIQGELIGYPDNNSRKIDFRFGVTFATLETEIIQRKESPLYSIKLSQNTRTILLATHQESHFNEWMGHLRRFCFLQGFWDNYDSSSEQLDHHNQKAIIKIVQSKKDGMNYIAKIYHREKAEKNPSLLAQIKNEIAIMMPFEHAGLTSLVEIYRDPEYTVLVIEFARGGNLCNRLIDKKRFDELEAAALFKNLIEGLQNLHQNGIYHRDLKLENIFLTSTSHNVFVKIGDFDLATFSTEVDRTKIVGTPGYIAPEVYESARFSTKSDIYSAGVILYALLVGKYPFRPKEAKELFFQREISPLCLETGSYKELSREVRNLIVSMLAAKPEDRPTTEDILKSEWLSRNAEKFLETMEAVSYTHLTLPTIYSV